VQVDVFSTRTGNGNPLAVVIDSEGLTDSDMTTFARWTNLSETVFLVPPREPRADYSVRIFTPTHELDFAGHPTLGACHAWLTAGGMPTRPDLLVQECRAGLVELRRIEGRLAFAAPPLRRDGPVDEHHLARACEVLGVDRSAVIDSSWCDNGPGWLAVRLADARAVLAVRPDFSRSDGSGIGVIGTHPLGVVGLHPPGADHALEVRAFFRSGNGFSEDPVTGSLNAAVAQWLISEGTLEAPHVAAQGGAVGRAGRVRVHVADGEIWVGGDTCTAVEGSLTI
jgi:PhzF family phenazine biosynthesis protein